jgi:hypothetical protein
MCLSRPQACDAGILGLCCTILCHWEGPSAERYCASRPRSHVMHVVHAMQYCSDLPLLCLHAAALYLDFYDFTAETGCCDVS